MVVGQPDRPILYQHRFKQAIAISECAIIYLYGDISVVCDLSVEVDVGQNNRLGNRS